mmetsp:Transcript_2187/g.3212  ORF Transcript_2187/g.3212 Transcript_2187/m.3212 type:complete len:408 (-) Transcript_2187:56-1279(-)
MNGERSTAAMSTGFYYLKSPNARASLKSFKYSGTDDSYLYKIILSPLAGFLVDNFTPSTIAPNTITLFGFCFMIIALLLTFWLCPNLDDEDAPRWMFLYFGIAMLIYQTLDNMDGKQARKTGSSSPLGLLFDHGCDALNVSCGINIILCTCAVARSNVVLIFWTMISPQIPFYMASWEESYTHTLYLPTLNGPNEGVLLASLMCFVSGVLGTSFWELFHLYDSLPTVLAGVIPKLNNGEMMVYVGLVLSFREMLAKMIFVAKRHGVQSWSTLAPLVLNSALWGVVVTKQPDLFERNVRTCLNISGLLLFEMVTQVMFDHMTKQRNNPIRWVMLPLIYFCLAMDDMDDAGQDLFLVSYLVGLFVFLSMKVFLIIHECCCCLEIYCFDIVTKYQSLCEKEEQAPEKKNK